MTFEELKAMGRICFLHGKPLGLWAYGDPNLAIAYLCHATKVGKGCLVVFKYKGYEGREYDDMEFIDGGSEEFTQTINWIRSKKNLAPLSREKVLEGFGRRFAPTENET